MLVLLCLRAKALQRRCSLISTDLVPRGMRLLRRFRALFRELRVSRVV